MAALLPSAATGLASSRQCQRSRLPNQPASHYAPARCAAKPWGGPGRLPALVARSQEPGKEPGQEDLPPWVRREKERELQAAQAAKGGLPWGLSLLFSVFTTIAATGSIFEYVDRNPVFGILQPDNPLWAPILLFMAITGYPMAAFLFKRGVDGFNEAAEEMDRMDGYR